MDMEITKMHHFHPICILRNAISHTYRQRWKWGEITSQSDTTYVIGKQTEKNKEAQETV